MLWKAGEKGRGAEGSVLGVVVGLRGLWFWLAVVMSAEG